MHRVCVCVHGANLLDVTIKQQPWVLLLHGRISFCRALAPHHCRVIIVLSHGKHTAYTFTQAEQ